MRHEAKRWMAMAWVMLLVGCGGGGGVDEVGDASMDMSPEATVVPTTCEAVCATRMANAEDSGFCAMDGHLGLEPCEAYCARGEETWGEDEGAAFETCATTYPLCFRDIEQCMVAELYGTPPASVEHVVTLRVEGLEANAGQAVYAQLLEDFAEEPVEILAVDDAGLVEHAWERGEAPLPDIDYQISLYVDVDGSGGCSPEVDRLYSEQAEARFGTTPIEYRVEFEAGAEVEPPARDSFCERFSESP